MSQKELADFLYLEKSTVNRNIDRLLKQNLLRIDERNKVAITDCGIDQVKRIIPIWEKAMEEAEQALGKQGMSSLDSLIQVLTVN